MSLYVDSSALLKRYVDEPDSNLANEILGSDESLMTARHTIVEVRRNLGRLLDQGDAAAARSAFLEDVKAFGIVELDAFTCESAASISELTGARTRDALHLAAAQRLGGSSIGFVTFDLRQAQAARTLGMTVLPGLRALADRDQAAHRPKRLAGMERRRSGAGWRRRWRSCCRSCDHARGLRHNRHDRVLFRDGRGSTLHSMDHDMAIGQGG